MECKRFLSALFVNTRRLCRRGQSRRAFTLAEVLITLVVIGIIAVVIIPVIIQKHNNLVVEARLVKFYRDINMALQLAELENGDKKDWYFDPTAITFEYEEDGVTPILGSSSTEKWFKQYLSPYLNIVSVKYINNRPTFYFADGSALMATSLDYAKDVAFFPGDPEKCFEREGETWAGKCGFYFCYYPTGESDPNNSYHTDKGFEPYKYRYKGDREALFNNTRYGCNSQSAGRNYCTAIIQENGWKIPKDYPFKVSY